MGTRVQGPKPKQFARMGQLPVLVHTLHRCAEALHFDKILLTLPENYHEDWQQTCRHLSIVTPHQVVTGGAERFHSVKNALCFLIEQGANGWVGIHDGVRPFVDGEMIKRLFGAATEETGVIPVTKPRDSLRIRTSNDWQPVDREQVRNVQTPQVFPLQKLWEAYQLTGSRPVTDDAQVWENAGYALSLVEGNPANFKLTTDSDMAYARFVFENGTTFHTNS